MRVKPQVTARLPEGWQYKEQLTLYAEDGHGNVIASTEPLTTQVDAKEYARIQGDLLRAEFPGYREEAFEAISILGGHEGFLRRFEWTPPEGVPVTQLQLYGVVDGRGFTATATVQSADFARYELELAEVLKGLGL